MNMKHLNSNQKLKHQRALSISQNYLNFETRLIDALFEVEESGAHRVLGYSSLFKYAVEALKLSEPTAYMMITTARKSREVPLLRNAIQAKEISLHQASRMAAAINNQNAVDLISFAKSHTTRELEFEVRRRNPKANVGESVRAVSRDYLEITVRIHKDDFDEIKRAQDLIAKKAGETVGYGATFVQTVKDFNKRHHPVEKAKRALDRVKRKKTEAHELCARRVADVNPSESAKVQEERRTVPTRKPLTAEQKHKVFARDEGRCTFIELNGQRCTNERWVHFHHVTPVSQGGSNDPENLTTLCSPHHDLVHQLSLPIEGQVSWLRSPRVEYCAS